MIPTTVRAAAKQLDWSKLAGSLPKESAASLLAFRKRNDEVKRLLHELKEQSTTVDFAHYRKVLKNQDIVAQSEKALSGFKPVTYDLDAQLKAIDKFEAKAVEKAKQKVQQIDTELKDLHATLDNIQGSRPIEQLKVDDILNAKPEIVKEIEGMLQKGKFTIPGYKEKFGDISYF
ncbi:uncharacterized protein BYT42DRAFT_525095 [Radiomyces spectabilis]|uniref:uncharacterized protein n=1 Tax=Radiomyces spectabilis TaxID=64574 RepID=UPI002220BB6F|nr:uncharacterized protein BYT42DRAFT_525095 [Radiomyces spectabilis]KAI8393814.1 hypothetical protein BYT42DRAFT_525095 [Radiomyces spectabilis]